MTDVSAVNECDLKSLVMYGASVPAQLDVKETKKLMSQILSVVRLIRHITHCWASYMT